MRLEYTLIYTLIYEYWDIFYRLHNIEHMYF